MSLREECQYAFLKSMAQKSVEQALALTTHEHALDLLVDVLMEVKGDGVQIKRENELAVDSNDKAKAN